MTANGHPTITKAHLEQENQEKNLLLTYLRYSSEKEDINQNLINCHTKTSSLAYSYYVFKIRFGCKNSVKVTHLFSFGF